MALTDPFSTSASDITQSGDTLRTAQLEVGMGFYSQCTAVLVSAHQKQAYWFQKNYPFFLPVRTILPVSEEQHV